jgi:uncharacterized membrane protein YedE/YeeE
MQTEEEESGLSVGMVVRVLLAGMYFGIVLVKSEVVSWTRINRMFLFQEPHMYLIIATAVVVGALSMLLIRRFEIKTVKGQPIVYKPKPFQKGVVIGGIIFGMGWAITGACPGPIYAQIGSGAWPAIFTFGGAMVGMYLYGYFQQWLPH